MKFNWGTGIVLSFVFFIAFILFFVIKATTNKEYDHDLVTDDYYKKELVYQKNIDKEANSKNLTNNISWKKTDEGMLVLFPQDFDAEKIKGKVFLYRPSNKKFDYETSISLSNHKMLIPKSRLLDGRWNISVDWSYKGKEYLFQEKIVY